MVPYVEVTYYGDSRRDDSRAGGKRQAYSSEVVVSGQDQWLVASKNSTAIIQATNEDFIWDLTIENSTRSVAIALQLGLTFAATSAKMIAVRSSANPQSRLSRDSVYAH